MADNSSTKRATKQVHPDVLTELGFLFDDSVNITNYDNRNTIDGRITSKYSGPSGYTVIFKNKSANNTAGIINYIKTSVNVTDGLNPYAKLIADFNGKAAMKLKASDFAYLSNLGVYPLNRLWVLRRFAEDQTVPDNLEDWTGIQPSPVSTIVGWIDKDDKDLLSMSFGETWTTTSEMLHTLLLKIVKDEFKINLGDSVPVPGFTRGLLFTFLKEMDLVSSDWGLYDIPVGDPNILKKGATRSTSPDADFNLTSKLDLTLKTSYEMKYIGDVDPGSAMLDCIENLIYMGTSNTKFIMNASQTKQFTTAFNSTGIGRSKAWLILITTLVEKFMSAVTKLFDDLKLVASKTIAKPAPKTDAQKAEAEKTQPTTQGLFQKTAEAAIADMKTLTEGTVGTILASTVAIYKWPLKGSVGLMSGISTTPWHLTIGNPYSPFISISNMVVNDVKLDFSNEFTYNDMPTKVDATISVRLGRDLGAQEISRMFNNSYNRVYSSSNTAQPFLIRKNL